LRGLAAARRQIRRGGESQRSVSRAPTAQQPRTRGRCMGSQSCHPAVFIVAGRAITSSSRSEARVRPPETLTWSPAAGQFGPLSSCAMPRSASSACAIRGDVGDEGGLGLARWLRGVARLDRLRLSRDSRRHQAAFSLRQEELRRSGRAHATHRNSAPREEGHSKPVMVAKSPPCQQQQND